MVKFPACVCRFTGPDVCLLMFSYVCTEIQRFLDFKMSDYFSVSVSAVSGGKAAAVFVFECQLKHSFTSTESSSEWSLCSGSVDAAGYLSARLRRTRGLMSMTKTLALIHLALIWSAEALTLSDLLR